MNKSIIKLTNIHYKNILNNLSMNFEKEKFYTILGPSGCGKTTLLNLIAGFIHCDSGNIFIDSVDVTNFNAPKREVNTVFQDYSLFEHLNVFENIEFGLKIKKIKKIKRIEIIDNVLNLVKMNDFKYFDISKLSGGQKQRVAIARALVMNPKVLLLDEPFSALDFNLRQEMQYMLKEIQKKLNMTFIFVTHDQEEALFLSDYIYVLNDGVIEQCGSPKEIYDNPEKLFVANFIGKSNVFIGRIIDDSSVSFINKKFKYLSNNNFEKNAEVYVIIRPEDIILKKDGLIKVVINTKIFKGILFEYIVIDEKRNSWIVQTKEEYSVNSSLCLSIPKGAVYVISK